MLYNEKKQIAVLVDAKSSVSDRGTGGIVDDVSKADSLALEHKNKMEEFIGTTISKIEYVIVVPAFYAKNVLERARLHKPNVAQASSNLK
jgi:hypothetical protein